MAILSAEPAGSVFFCGGVGRRRVVFPNAIEKGTELALLADTRECTKNGRQERQECFYRYSAAPDSKHKVAPEDGKATRVVFDTENEL